MARLQEFYKETVVPQLLEKFGYKSVMEVPRITKVTLNMGVGEAVGDKKVMEHAVGDMTKIAGQKPVVTVARKAIAGFKIREGYPIGCMVTLRGNRMYEFLDRFITVAIPRIRDFRGVSGKSFDGRGNYNIGVKEQIIFPEVEYDKIDALRGMNISITTTAKKDEEAKALLVAFKFPFKNGGSHGKTITHQPRSQACQAGGQICRQAHRTPRHHQQRQADRRGAHGCAPQDAAVATQLQSDAAAQSLPCHWAPAWCLQKIWPMPHQTPRSSNARRGAWHDQVELVRRSP